MLILFYQTNKQIQWFKYLKPTTRNWHTCQKMTFTSPWPSSFLEDPGRCVRCVQKRCISSIVWSIASCRERSNSSFLRLILLEVHLSIANCISLSSSWRDREALSIAIFTLATQICFVDKGSEINSGTGISKWSYFINKNPLHFFKVLWTSGISFQLYSVVFSLGDDSLSSGYHFVEWGLQ